MSNSRFGICGQHIGGRRPFPETAFSCLFSPSTKNPNEWDEARIRGLADFAADIAHRSSPERNEGEERVYFTRIRTLIV